MSTAFCFGHLYRADSHNQIAGLFDTQASVVEILWVTEIILGQSCIYIRVVICFLC